MINIAKPLMGPEEKQAVLDVLDSGMIACGSVVSEFEKEFAEYLGIEYCTATTSGTTALEVGLRALGIGRETPSSQHRFPLSPPPTPLFTQEPLRYLQRSIRIHSSLIRARSKKPWKSTRPSI